MSLVQLQVLALPAAVELQLPGQHLPDALLAALLLARQVQTYGDQQKLTALRGLNRGNMTEKEKKQSAQVVCVKTMYIY